MGDGTNVEKKWGRVLLVWTPSYVLIGVGWILANPGFYGQFFSLALTASIILLLVNLLVGVVSYSDPLVRYLGTIAILLLDSGYWYFVIVPSGTDTFDIISNFIILASLFVWIGFTIYRKHDIIGEENTDVGNFSLPKSLKRWWEPIVYFVILGLLLSVPGAVGGDRTLVPVVLLLLIAGPPVLSTANTVRGGSLGSSLSVGLVPGIWLGILGAIQWYIQAGSTDWSETVRGRPSISPYLPVDFISLSLAIGVGGAVVGILVGRVFKRVFRTIPRG